MIDIVGSSTTIRIAALALLSGFVATSTARADCQPTGPAPFCLAGTVTATGVSAAVIEEPGKPGLNEVHTGDSLGDWTVAEIGHRFVTLQRDDQSIRLDLRGEAAHSIAQIPTMRRPPLRNIDPRIAHMAPPQPPKQPPQIQPQNR